MAKSTTDEHSRKTDSFSTRHTAMIEFPVIVPITVRWGDMDAFGHVNNTRYFQYFEQARIAYFQSTMGDVASPPDGIGPILHSTSCRFRAPVKHPDTLQIGARVHEIQDDRLVMIYRIYSNNLDRIAAEGDAVVVAFDYSGEVKSRVPKHWIDRIESVEGRSLRSS